MNYTVAGGRVYFDQLSFQEVGSCILELSVDSWPSGDVCKFGADFLPVGSEVWQELSSGVPQGDGVDRQGNLRTTVSTNIDVPAGASVRPWIEPLQDFSTTVSVST